jgi:hypothetical protein
VAGAGGLLQSWILMILFIAAATFGFCSYGFEI